jgi:hypothetical protein
MMNKNNTLLTLAVVAMASLFLTGSASAVWTDNFDSYSNESTIIGQGAWVGWEQAGTDDTTVSSTFANSGTNSLLMGATTLPTDVVAEFSGVTSGLWNFEVMTYVPTGTSSWVDIGHLAAHKGFQGAEASQWFTAFSIFSSQGWAGLGGGSVPIVRDTWVPVQGLFDIDAQSVEYFYNGTSAGTTSWAGNDVALVGFDMWTAGGAVGDIYLDDFSVTPFDDNNSTVVLGDVNLDGLVNGLDVDPFVGLVTSGTYQDEGDMNEDGMVNGLDVDPFVAAVVGGGTQQIPEPSTLLLCIVALGVLGAWRKWRG